MTTRLSRERAHKRALDHLHTRATELARFASKVRQDGATATRVGATTSGVDVETPSNYTASSSAASSVHGNPGLRVTRLRKRNRRSKWTLLGTALCALLFAGSASLAGGAASSNVNSAPDSVLAFGAAPALGSGAGLSLHAGVVAMAADPAAPGYWLAASDGGVFAFGASSFFGSTGGAPLNAPVVGITATPDGRGYWLVGSDGGVFTFGDATYFGSMAGTPLASPITSIVSTHDGGGYWLIGADGGIFIFGDAGFYGSAESLHLARPIVGATATRSGEGYWLVGSDGGVFSFGDARFAGAQPDLAHPAVGIAAAPGGDGYWIAHTDGSVSGFHVSPSGNDALFSTTAQPRTVAVAASSAGGYWIAQGESDTTSSALASDPFLACTRAHESDRAGGYGAVSPGGTYRGAYQFDQSTWNSAARLAGRPDLIGVDPATAAPADQDLLALDLFHQRGSQPWGNRCGGLT
jgi:hypothetical protein